MIMFRSCRSRSTQAIGVPHPSSGKMLSVIPSSTASACAWFTAVTVGRPPGTVQDVVKKKFRSRSRSNVQCAALLFNDTNLRHIESARCRAMRARSTKRRSGACGAVEDRPDENRGRKEVPRSPGASTPSLQEFVHQLEGPAGIRSRLPRLSATSA